MGKGKTFASPERGDRVKLRGKVPQGILGTMNNLSWCCVDWDNGVGPKFCHIKELEVISPQEP